MLLQIVISTMPAERLQKDGAQQIIIIYLRYGRLFPASTLNNSASVFASQPERIAGFVKFMQPPLAVDYY